MPWVLTTLAGALIGIFVDNATSQPVQGLPNGSTGTQTDEGKFYKFAFFTLGAYVVYKLLWKK